MGVGAEQQVAAVTGSPSGPRPSVCAAVPMEEPTAAPMNKDGAKTPPTSPEPAAMDVTNTARGTGAPTPVMLLALSRTHSRRSRLVEVGHGAVTFAVTFSEIQMSLQTSPPCQWTRWESKEGKGKLKPEWISLRKRHPAPQGVRGVLAYA